MKALIFDCRCKIVIRGPMAQLATRSPCKGFLERERLRVRAPLGPFVFTWSSAATLSEARTFPSSFRPEFYALYMYRIWSSCALLNACVLLHARIPFHHKCITPGFAPKNIEFYLEHLLSAEDGIKVFWPRFFLYLHAVRKPQIYLNNAEP